MKCRLRLSPRARIERLEQIVPSREPGRMYCVVYPNGFKAPGPAYICREGRPHGMVEVYRGQRLPRNPAPKLYGFDAHAAILGCHGTMDTITVLLEAEKEGLTSLTTKEL